MYMTEAEARCKWCAFARAIVPDNEGQFTPPANRVVQGGTLALAPALCIASQCMMWREGTLVDARGERKGYCGLAGAPANFISH